MVGSTGNQLPITATTPSTEVSSPSPRNQSNNNRKQKHRYGAYQCDHAGCNKIFQRSDHLTRHKLTHDATTKKYECQWPNCSKKFNRSDTMKLHYNRHKKYEDASTTIPGTDSDYTSTETHDKKKRKKSTTNTKKDKVITEAASGLLQHQQQHQQQAAPSLTDSQVGSSNAGTISTQAATPVPQIYSQGLPIIPTSSGVNHISQSQGSALTGQNGGVNPNVPMVSKISDLLNSNLAKDILMNEQTKSQSPGFSSASQTPLPSIQDTIGGGGAATLNEAAFIPEAPQSDMVTNQFQPSDLLSFLFREEVAPAKGKFNSQFGQGQEEDGTNDIALFPSSGANSYNLFDPSQNTLLEQLSNFPMSPASINFSVGAHIHVDAEVMNRLAFALPSISSNPNFNMPAIHRALQLYWGLHSYRISIIHKPSFDTRTAAPLLLLAMVMAGAALSVTTEQDESIFTDPCEFAEEIASSLRWLIFQSPEFSSAPSWVLQSLIILEVHEKHMSTRVHFERSTIHHATKVQILRRSTILGGDPYRKDNFEAETLWGSRNKSAQLFKRWIEAESMKRCAYATFIMDAFNSVLTNQTLTLYAYQLKISLPCDEELWFTANFDQELFKNHDWKTHSFLSAFIEMLNEESGTVDKDYWIAILLAGIITLIFLFQSATSMRFQNTAKDDNWRDMLTYCLESWLVNVSDGSCCSKKSAEAALLGGEFGVSTPYKSPEDRRCHMPIYHMAFTTLRLSNYDWMTYAGTPFLMNVSADYSNYDALSMRIKKWSSSSEGGVCIVNAYLAIIECLLPPDGMENPANFQNYRPEKDYLMGRAYCLAQLGVIIWCYNYSAKGPESGFLNNDINYTHYMNDNTSINPHVKIEGYAYLIKIKNLFMAQDPIFDHMIQKEMNANTLTPSTKTAIYHKRLQAYGVALDALPDSHHVAGLLLLMSEIFANCRYELCQELSRLLKHCQSRSMGNKEIKCMNMYNSS